MREHYTELRKKLVGNPKAKVPKLRPGTQMQIMVLVPKFLPVWQEGSPDNASVIIRHVCNFYKLTREQLVSSSRQKRLVYVRSVTCYLLRTLLPSFSMPKIGIILGNRDHTTILHALQCADERVLHDGKFSKEILDLTGRIKGITAPNMGVGKWLKIKTAISAS